MAPNEPMDHHANGTAEDPVCHMTVTVSPTTLKSTYQGHDYYFCCQACKNAFDKDPAKYL
jgi:YHS domain-containing protein